MILADWQLIVAMMRNVAVVSDTRVETALGWEEGSTHFLEIERWLMRH